MVEPPLLRFYRALSPDEKEAFVEAIGTTPGYMDQFVRQAAPNPNLKLALAIEAETHRLSRQMPHLVPVSLQDLLIGRILTKWVKDHTTGETFTLMPNGKMVRRRVDAQGRIVLVDDHGGILDVEETHPGVKTLAKTLPL